MLAIVVYASRSSTPSTTTPVTEELSELVSQADDIRSAVRRKYYVDIQVLLIEKGKVVDLKGNDVFEFAIHSKQSLVNNVSVVSSYPEIPGQQRVQLREGVMYSTRDPRISFGMTLINGNEDPVVVEVHRVVW